MPTSLTEIIEEMNSILEPARFQDYAPNGLQVPGSEHVTTVATGVSANLELFERARDEHAELLLVHHGIFWGSGFTTVDATLKRRLEILFDANISLAAYHLPLDAHPELGNNALIARALGAERLEPFAIHKGQSIGFLAHFAAEGLPASELLTRVQELTNRTPMVFDCGPALVQRMAIVSGAGSDFLADASAAGADALLTGEIPERAMAQARESGLHLIAAGHYATETFGVKHLGEHLARHFGLRHVFLDVPNPV